MRVFPWNGFILSMRKEKKNKALTMCEPSSKHASIISLSFEKTLTKAKKREDKLLSPLLSSDQWNSE